MIKIMAFLLFALGVFASCGTSLPDYIKSKAHRLETAQQLDVIIEKTADRKLVLLGEASHGTHEYYAWRDSISRRLIAENGFNFIAVEGDFASLYELNRYVKNMPGAAATAREVLLNLDRWPQWMWGNHEVAGLAEWLRTYNDNLPAGIQKVGFYGMDVYDEWRSKDAVLSFLQQHSQPLYEQVKELYECLAPYGRDSWQYARSVQGGAGDCQQPLSKVVELIRQSRHKLDQVDAYEFFYVLQNAMVKQNAEKFYRKSATRRDASSWNARVHHMHETVNRLLDLYGQEARGIVWAHNTHVGDARFTEMYNAGNQNIGELSRVKWGPENVFIIGFTTYKGQVQAGASWGSTMQEMPIAPARENSAEYILNQTGLPRFFVLFDEEDRTHEEFMDPVGNRAVGVVFNPANEPRQYVNTILPLRYDVIVFFNQTRALDAL